MTEAIGLIAEDKNDVLTIKTLMRRVWDKNGRRHVRVKSRKHNGCGAIKRKCAPWVVDLASHGCTRIVVVHDLDLEAFGTKHNDEEELRKTLEAIVVEAGVELDHLICIPIEEIEAWFWSDPELLAYVSHGRCHNDVANPHLMKKPKEKLHALSRDAGGKPLISENSNPKLAARLNLDVCAKKCRAFKMLYDFLLAA